MADNSTTDVIVPSVQAHTGQGLGTGNPADAFVIEPARARTKRTPRATRTNFELIAWLFMRLSGVVLVVLILGHLVINLMLDGGVSKVSFAFVAGRWANPWWQVWDLTMLWLAMLHGSNGLRTVINDYAEKESTRLWLKGLLLVATVFTVLLGTLVIFTFNPNI